MRNYLKILAVFFWAIFALTLISIKDVKAGGIDNAGCVPVYGGGVQCPKPGEILIDKTVRNPSTGIYVDNLGVSDPKYRPQWTINFRILVKNSGDKTLEKVTVTDIIPQYVDFMSGPGNFDAKTRTLTFEVANLGGGASQLFEFKGRIVHTAVLPADKNVVCTVNTVDAKADAQTDHDEAQFCIQKELVVPEVPSAGPEHWILSFAGFSALLTIGTYFRKKALV